MISPKEFHKKIKKLGVSFFTGIPDSLLKNYCYYIDDYEKNEDHIIAANEGGALAIAIGYNLATGKIPLIYLQNSGFGNLVNPLLSLTDKDVYSIPGILLIGWRGEPDIPDEPQHKKQGKITLDLLDTMDIPYYLLDKMLDDTEIENILNQCIKDVKSKSRINALVVKKGFFDNYKPVNKDQSKFKLTRERAIELVVSQIKDGLIIATTGLASRELYDYRNRTNGDHSQDFLVVGGMGHANQIAMGIALQSKKKRIICLDGDGAVIMHMGSLPIIGSNIPNNMIHILLNNGAHDSVGGQNTVGFEIDLSEIAKISGYKEVFSFDTEAEILSAINEISKMDGPIFVEIKVKKGFRDEIGRPKTTPIENKNRFVSRLKES